jgi:hypothetical protein
VRVRRQRRGSMTNPAQTAENRTASSVMWRDWVKAPSEHFQVNLALGTMCYDKMDIGAARLPMAASGLSIVRFHS